MRLGGKEYHKPDGVRISMMQELVRPVEQVNYQIIKADDLRHYTGGEPVSIQPICFLHGTIWMF